MVELMVVDRWTLPQITAMIKSLGVCVCSSIFEAIYTYSS